ncbi:MAG: AI-2E family transporter [Lachnospiraceae bacterium]|nr:AI-2E family transporter [Lachnospiraceae bacterium]
MEKRACSMLEKIRQNRPLLLILLTGVVWFFLEFVVPLICPVLLALLFVTIFGPLLKKIQEKLHVHRQIGAVILIFTALAFVGVLVWILSSWILGSLPGWLSGLDAAKVEIQTIVHKGCDTMGHLVGVDSVHLESTIMSSINENMHALGSHAVPGMLSQSLEYMKLVGVLGGFLVTFSISTVLLAKDYDDIMNRMLEREECHVVLEVICGVIRYIATFVKAQALIMAVVGATAAAVLGLAKIENGVLWGLLAGVLDALPFIGTSIVLIPLAIVQFIQGSYVKVIVCLILYGVCIVLREVLEPRLIGNRMGVPAIAVLVSLYAGIQLFGVWGIVKGPLGFVLIRESYLSIRKEKD